MCMFSPPKPNAPVLPTETAKTKAPDGAVVRSEAGRRTMDRIRSGTDTILTSGSGVTTAAPTDKKTLLGE